MQRLIITIILNLVFITTFGQKFPVNNPEFLLNQIVKPKEISESLQSKHYKKFFLEFDKEKKQFTKDEKENKPFPSGPSYSLVSDYNKLNGKEFKVLAVYKTIPKNPLFSIKYVLEIENKDIGIVYYMYDPDFEDSIELEVIGELKYPENYFCDKIEYKKDKFENKETFYSPTENGIKFIKTVENGKSHFYLSVSTSGITLNVNEKGLYILFSDGTKISKPNEEIDVDVSSGSGYDYSSFIQLTSTEIRQLTMKSITDFKLYIYEETIDDESALKIKEYLKCLSK